MADKREHPDRHRRTNPPEHIFDEGSGLKEGVPQPPNEENWHHRQTGIGTAPPDKDVADPHPSDEGDPYAEPAPGGDAMPPGDTDVGHKNIGPNPARHSGNPPPRPHNAGSGPE